MSRAQRRISQTNPNPVRAATGGSPKILVELIFWIELATFASMKKHETLNDRKRAPLHELNAAINETPIGFSEANTPTDQAAFERGLADLDAGKGIAWENFKKKFERYAI
jgi:hypothetical protein